MRKMEINDGHTNACMRERFRAYYNNLPPVTCNCAGSLLKRAISLLTEAQNALNSNNCNAARDNISAALRKLEEM